MAELGFEHGQYISRIQFFSIRFLYLIKPSIPLLLIRCLPCLSLWEALGAPHVPAWWLLLIAGTVPETPSICACLGSGQGLALCAGLPVRGCCGWGLPLGWPSPFTEVPNCPLCAPSPIHTQVWPPGERKGQCGAATEPADSGGLARGIR